MHKSKLTLRRHTLRQLTIEDARAAAGGAAKEYISIPVNNCVSKIPWNCPTTSCPPSGNGACM